jgi:hypothetical protein
MAKAHKGRSTAATPTKQPVEVAERLIAAAGPNRLSLPDDLLIQLDSQWRWTDARKIEELEKRIARLAKYPNWWPAFRPVRGCADAEAIVTLLADVPRSKAWLARKLRKTVPAINALTVALNATGKIVRVEPGKFGSPEGNAQPFVSATHQIIAALIATAGQSMRRIELMAATNGAAIDRPLHTLVHSNGVLISPKRGTFALSPDTLAKIAQGKAIHDRRGGILWAPPGHMSQWAAILQETKRLTAHASRQPSSAVVGAHKHKGGRPSVWTGAKGQALVLEVNATLETMGLARTDKNAVRNAIATIFRGGSYKPTSEESLRVGYYRARRHHGDSPARSHAMIRCSGTLSSSETGFTTGSGTGVATSSGTGLELNSSPCRSNISSVASRRSTESKKTAGADFAVEIV